MNFLSRLLNGELRISPDSLSAVELPNHFGAVCPKSQLRLYVVCYIDPLRLYLRTSGIGSSFAEFTRLMAGLRLYRITPYKMVVTLTPYDSFIVLHNSRPVC